jgi:hypothetical protein
VKRFPLEQLQLLCLLLRIRPRQLPFLSAQLYNRIRQPRQPLHPTKQSKLLRFLLEALAQQRHLQASHLDQLLKLPRWQLLHLLRRRRVKQSKLLLFLLEALVQQHYLQTLHSDQLLLHLQQLHRAKQSKLLRFHLEILVQLCQHRRFRSDQLLKLPR